MVPYSKHLAMAMLAGTLWLSGSYPAWAASESQREQFIAFLAKKQSRQIANRLDQNQAAIAGQLNNLTHQLAIVSNKLKNPPSPPILVRLAK